MTNTLAERMREYEDVFRYKLPRRLPLLIRLDGKAFHTLTRNYEKPWDTDFMSFMDSVALFLCKKVQTVQLAYLQSDELTLLLHNYKKLNSEPWFDNTLQKIVSISAGYASAYFSVRNYQKNPLLDIEEVIEVFDSRAWVLPESEVNNILLSRQQDATRNAIQMLGQAHFSHNQLQNKSCSQIQELLWQEHKINFNEFEPYYKRGRCVVRGIDGWFVDRSIPIFSQDPNYIEQWLATNE